MLGVFLVYEFKLDEVSGPPSLSLSDFNSGFGSESVQLPIALSLRWQDSPRLHVRGRAPEFPDLPWLLGAHAYP